MTDRFNKRMALGGEGRQLSPQQLGHLGGTGRWYGKEAVEKEKERMGQDAKGDEKRGYDRKESGKGMIVELAC